jgi:hypothetical protein
LSGAAQRLITRHVDSVGALDLLLLMHRTADRDWRLAELCAELRCPSAWAVKQLRVLDALGLVIQPAPGRHRYVRGRQHGPAVDEIALVHRDDPASVAKLVFARPPQPASLRADCLG